MSSTPVSFSGLVSGLDTTSIINAEMAVYEEPLTSLQNQQSTINTQISDYQTILNQLLGLQQASNLLSTPTNYAEAFSTASTDPAVATATVSGATQPGSLTFSVDQLATGSTQISAGTVASPNNVIASGDLLVGSGGAALGIASFGAASGLATGSHSVSVTQASSGATVTGTSPVAPTTTIDATDDELDVTVNGTAQTVTLAAGTYTAAQLAAAVTSASGGTLSATAEATGELTLATTQQGSSATLQVTGGSALGALGLSAGGAVQGTDGVIDVDGTATTVTDIAGSGTTAVTVASGTGGTVTLNLSGPLNVGSLQAADVSVGNGSLTSVVSAINLAGVGVTANALQVGANSYALELTSTGTGTAASTTIDAGAFATSSLGTLTTTTAAQDAEISIGGPGGYLVTSHTNAVTGLLPGITVNLAQVSAAPVTISVSPDGSQMESNVEALVDAANTVLSTIQTDTAYNVSSNTAGPLNGNYSLSALAQQILSVVGAAIGGSAAGSDGTAGESAGLAITSSGTITFNQSAFEAAYDANPSAVQSMFTVGGTFQASNGTYTGTVGVAGATDDTAPGSYDVTVSQSASQATDTGSATWAAPTSTLGSAETYTVTGGAGTATYAAAAGESVADVIAGLNEALAQAGIQASAALEGGAGTYQVQLTSAGYGAGSSFTVAASGTDQLGLLTSGSTYAGTDVAGSIDGQAAVGSGQTLSLTDPGDPANGLVLKVTATGITSATDLGTVQYAPGFAQSLAHIAKTSSLNPGGVIPVTISGLQGTLAEVTSEITMQQQLVATQKASLTAEFTSLEETLEQLNSESSFLQSAYGSSSSSSSSGSSGSSSTGTATSSGSGS